MKKRNKKLSGRPMTFSINKSKVLAIDKLNLHEKFTRENFLNLCSLRWSEWGRWRRFFVIAGAIAAIVVSAPSFVMVLPCVTVFYLISCTVKNAVEIVANWKWGPIFPKKKIKKGSILAELEEENFSKQNSQVKEANNLIQEREDEEDMEDYLLDSLENVTEEEEVDDGELELLEEDSPTDDQSLSEEDESPEEDLLLDENASLDDPEKTSKNSKRETLR